MEFSFLYLFVNIYYPHNKIQITKEDNRLVQIKKRGKRKKIYTYNKALVTALRMTMANQVPQSNHAIYGS